MKSVLLAASAVMLLCGVPSANAQSAGPTYDNSIHQSAGPRDSRGFPKYYQPQRYHHVRRFHRDMPATTGAGSGPYYDNSIHQSAGERDSRGNPKYYKGD